MKLLKESTGMERLAIGLVIFASLAPLVNWS